MRILTYIGFLLLVTIHHLIVLSLVISIPITIVFTPWYVALIVNVFVIRKVTSAVVCPLTVLENKLRVKLGAKEIKGFIGHYYIKHIRKVL